MLCLSLIRLCVYCVLSHPHVYIALLFTTAYTSEEMTRFPVSRGTWPAPPRMPGPRQIPHPTGRFSICSTQVLYHSYTCAWRIDRRFPSFYWKFCWCWFIKYENLKQSTEDVFHECNHSMLQAFNSSISLTTGALDTEPL